MFCEKCKMQADKDAEFCPYCGVKLNKNNKNITISKKTLLIITAIVIVCVLVVPKLFGNGKTTNTTNTTNTTQTDIYEGNDRLLINPVPETKTPQRQCSTCGGSGTKDCTSCDNGYYVEYESGQAFGYGPITREVKKRCVVCQGRGTVKCYH